jgi:hypothetical protein
MKTETTTNRQAVEVAPQGTSRRRYHPPRIERLGPVHGTVLGPSPGLGESGQPQARRL